MEKIYYYENPFYIPGLINIKTGKMSQHHQIDQENLILSQRHTLSCFPAITVFPHSIILLLLFIFFHNQIRRQF